MAINVFRTYKAKESCMKTGKSDKYALPEESDQESMLHG